MLKRLIKVLVSIAATAVVVIAVLTIAAVVGHRYPSHPDRSSANADIYVINDYRGSPMTCHRDNSGFAVVTDEYDEVLGIEPVSSGAELKRCIEAFKSGSLPFDPRNFIVRYEAGYVIWDGFDRQSIYHWDVPDECAPHYQFEKKSHPWLIDALGLIDTIEVTFAWTGTDTEWNTCFAARLKQIDEIDTSEFEFEISENSKQISTDGDSAEHSMTVAEPEPGLDQVTVMLNPSIINHIPTHLPSYSADIIRNGVLIREDFVQQGNATSVGPADAPISRNRSTYGDECGTILQLYADEIAEQFPGWHLVAVVDEDTAASPSCSIRKVGTTK